MIEKGLAAFLRGDTGIGNVATGGIYPEKIVQAPAGQSFQPTITFDRSGTGRIKSLAGPSGLAAASLRVHCLATTYGLAKTLADLVRNSQGGLGLTRSWAPGNPPNILDGFKGPMGTFTVQAAWVSDDVDGYTSPIKDDDVGIYDTSVEVEIWFQEN